MKKEHAIALAAVLVLLLGARLLLNRRGTHVAKEASEAGIVRLVPKTVDEEKVKWVRITGPAPKPPEAPKPGEPAPPAPPEAAKPLELAKGADGWTVTSAEGAPADESQVKDFVHKAVSLAGEVRGEGESTFARFELTPDKATKVEIGEEPGKPVATIWVGKQGDDADAHFARLDGSTEVRHVQDGLRAPLQLYAPDAHPATDLWVDKVVAHVEPKDVTKVTIERPDVTVVLEKQPAPDAAPAPTGPSGASAPPAAATRWRIISPEMPWAVQFDAIDGVVSRSAQTRVTSILPPGDPACTFEPSAGRVTFEKESSGTTSLRLGAKVADKEQVALQVEGKSFCYALGTWSVAQLLPRASSLWTIPQAFTQGAAADQPKKLKYQRAGTTCVLAKADDGNWSFESGGKGKADTSRCSRLSSGVTSLHVDDVADASKVPGAAQAVEATISLELGGKPVSVQVLGERPGGLGDRYVKLTGGNPMPPGYLGVISKATADSLLPTAEELKPTTTTGE